MHALMTQSDWKQPVIELPGGPRDASPPPATREEAHLEDAERWDGLY